MRRCLLVFLLLLAACSTAPAYTTKSGDTPGAIAQQLYGDFSYWKAMMWYNGLGQNPYTLPVGATINTPDKPTLDKVKAILAQNQPASATSQAIAALGGQASSVPTAAPNPGRGGAQTFYYALWSLKKPKLPSR